MKYLSPLFLIALFAACQTSFYQGDEKSPYYKVPIGSTLVLRQDIAIPPEQVGVLLQYGQILPSTQINRYYPHCKFEVRDRKAEFQHVRVDEFVVTRTTQTIDFSIDSGTMRLAGRDIDAGLLASGGLLRDGASFQVYITRLTLRSERQPQVWRLSCGQWEYPPHPRHVTIAEIRKTLGEVFTLRIAGGIG